MMKNQLRIMRFDAVDLAHSLSGRITKKEGSESSTRELGYANNASPSNTTFNLSIADVLGIVNTTHQSILSDDVLKALGETRNPEGYYASSVKFSKERMGKEDAATMEGNITERHNLTEEDLEAMYESPGIPVKSILADEDGVGDVSLVLRAKDAGSDSVSLLDMVAVVPDSADGWLLDKLKMNGLRVVGYKSVNLWEMPWR